MSIVDEYQQVLDHFYNLVNIMEIDRVYKLEIC